MSKYNKTLIRAVLHHYITQRLPVCAGRQATVDLGRVTDAVNAELYDGHRRLQLQDTVHIVTHWTRTSYHGLKQKRPPDVSPAVSRPGEPEERQ
jgi:hypothetical protein